MRSAAVSCILQVDIFSFGMFMFELLTCREPLAEVSNITVHVAHGGRPTLTTEVGWIGLSHIFTTRK